MVRPNLSAVGANKPNDLDFPTLGVYGALTIVAMDNLGSHKVEGVRAAIEARGAEVRYLPASPTVRS